MPNKTIVCKNELCYNNMKYHVTNCWIFPDSKDSERVKNCHTRVTWRAVVNKMLDLEESIITLNRRTRDV